MVSSSRSLCIHELIEAQVERSPDAPALIAGEESLSYRELNDRANVLAQELRALGVGPETIVGIHMQRSVPMILGMLATLKAGGAFAPMDPTSPTRRLAELPVSVVLSQHPFSSPPTRSNPVVVVCHDQDWDRGTTSSEPNLGQLALPGSLAYVITTSGSTGAPKAVAVEHRSLVSATLARIAFYGPPRVFLLLSAVAFDSALAGIFGTLAQGGALCLPPAGVEADPRQVAHLVAQHRVDALLALPSLYELVLEAAHGSQLASLETVTVAGEPCPPRLLAKSRRRVPATELVNEYGPTEGTIWSTAWRAPTRPAATDVTTVPIGRPVDGVGVHILNERLQPVPDGETGELWVSGAGVARGYLGRPDLTAASFRPDPAGLPGGRSYRTGDLARRRADGDLEFMGRLDRQLKIRGFRIEPAEVEDALVQYSGVRQAVVMASPRAPGGALVAFIVGDSVSPAGLRRFVRDRLPAYMVPTEICSVAALPLTPNGKVDHRSLASILSETEVGAKDLPRSAIESVVARIWGEVLGRERVGRTDNFLDLGESMDAMRIALQLSRLFQAEVPLLWVYEAPTVEGSAQLLETMVANASTIAEAWLATQSEARDDAPATMGVGPR